MMLYEEGTKVFFYNTEHNYIDEGKVVEGYADEEGGEYDIIDKDGHLHNYDELYVNIDKKELLLQILADAEQREFWHKRWMTYSIGTADKMCRLLEELDANINVKEELDNYKKKVKKYGY